MLNEKCWNEYRRSQGRLAESYAQSAQGAWTSYREDLDGIAAEARNTARLLAENYTGELRAAAAGDDTQERAGAAWSTYQREYAKLSEAYVASCQERYARFVEAIQEMQSEVGAKALDEQIGLLQAARDELAGGAGKAAHKPKEGGAGGGKKSG